MSYRVPSTRCTNCGKDMDAADPTSGGRGPKPGDVAICFYCHHLMVYGDELILRELTDQEIKQVAGEPEIILAMKALGEFKAKEKR